MTRWAVLAVALLLPGCGLLRRTPPAPPATPRYVVGAAYQAGGTWYYPREDFRYDATGLAAVLPDRRGLTADGEAFDGTAMAAAHQTLQLPAIARVTNLETGAQVLLRVNDRGPSSPARLLGLTRRAAERLGLPPGGVARVRVQVEDGPSQALRDRMGGNAGSGMAAAPRTGVVAESLTPPPGVGQSSRGRSVPGVVRTAAPDAAAPAPERLPEDVSNVGAAPGQLWIRAGSFGQAAYANQTQARLSGLGASVERTRNGRSDTFRVRAGPFPTVAAADAALDQALRAGVTDARIVVE